MPLPSTILPLTSLRAIGAFWVVAYHFDSELQVFATRAVAGGYLGVDLFFVLSGFVISHVYAESLAAGRSGVGAFLAARLARIYPLHLLTLFALLAMYGIATAAGMALNPQEYTAESFGLNLLLIQSWGFIDYLSWNYPSWSISAEFAAYLAFPLIAPLILRVPNRGTALVLGAGSILVLAGIARHANDGSLNLLYGLSLARVGCEFLLGCLTWRLASLDGSRGGADWRGVLALLALALVPIALYLRDADWPLLVLFAALIYGAATAGGRVASLLSASWLVWLGDISYSVYLLHILVRKSLVRGIAGRVADLSWPLQVLVFLACVALVIAMAAILHRAFEMPARRWLRQKLIVRPT